MSRALLVLGDKTTRDRAAAWCRNAPSGTRVEFKETKRTLPQNDRMWAMLTDVSKQVTHAGRRYTPDEWKVLFMHALGQQVEFLPSLDGSSFVPYGYHSSDLGKGEMTELIELMFAWGAEHGVVFHDPHNNDGGAIEHTPKTQAIDTTYAEIGGAGEGSTTLPAPATREREVV